MHKLHIGDPDLEPPPAFLRAIRSSYGPTIPYAPSAGLPDLIAAWTRYYARLGVSITPSDIVTTAGCAEAIHMALMAVADPGDEVIVFEPLYTGFKVSAQMHGVTLVPVDLSIADGFRLPPIAEIERRITAKTKAIVVINPDNPTGKAWSWAELERIIALAERENLFVIADETYREIVFGASPLTALRMRPSGSHVIVVDSLSKRFSVPGARLGCVASFNGAVMDAVLKFAMARLSAPTLEQLAAIPLLDDPAGYTEEIAAEYRNRRDAVVAALRKIDGVVASKPAGAFYVVAKLPIDDADRFVRFMLTSFSVNGATASVTPMADFYVTPGKGRDEVRIALVRPAAVLKEAIAVLAAGLNAYHR